MLRTAALAALLLSSVPSLAQTLGPRASDPAQSATAVNGADTPNGLQLELNVFHLGTLYSSDGLVNFENSFTGTNTGNAAGVEAGLASAAQPDVLVGYYFDQNAILLGIGFAAIGGSAGSGTSIAFGVSPTYRRYLGPVRPGAVSPFAEGEVAFSIFSPAGTGATTSTSVGVGGGGGLEWQFAKGFGFFAKATLNFTHNNTGGNLDGVGLFGDVGLNLHL